jgi:hypothetical protein
MSRRVKRCPHGFLADVPCFECTDLAEAIARARRVRALQSRYYQTRRADGVACALCSGVGHVSKFCPSTQVGNRRLAERGAA